MTADLPLHDVVAIGAGPFNLGLNALALRVPELELVTFEANASLRWHPGLMFHDARLQLSFLADLVTLVGRAASWAEMKPLSRTCSTAFSRGCTGLRWRGFRRTRTAPATSSSRLFASPSRRSTATEARPRSTRGSARFAATSSPTISGGTRAGAWRGRCCWRTSPTLARSSSPWLRPRLTSLRLAR
jgi:hypothetical protein